MAADPDAGTVLSRPHRLVSSRQFAQTVRAGRRARTRTLVLHLAETHLAETHLAETHLAETHLAETQRAHVSGPAQVGVVVGRAVGPAVARNRVKRRLRHIARERVAALPSAAALVIRALPAAARVPFAALSADFDAALARLGVGTESAETQVR